MKKIIYTFAIAVTFGSCSKWTEVESNAKEFEKVAVEDLIAKRDGAKWIAEDERTEENRKALDAYWEQLREYKQRAWLNTGEIGGQKPMFYFWFGSGFWNTQKGYPKTWLQAIPDSVTCISLWGGIGIRPGQMDEMKKKDLEVFHKKGSSVLLCWQTPSVGLGLPNSKTGVSGFTDFRNKYPFVENYNQWPELYARELARYIIAMDFDGYDVDWETGGDHIDPNKPYPYKTAEEEQEAITLMLPSTSSSAKYTDNPKNYVKGGDPRAYDNIGRFVKEMAKYFGPVGAGRAVATQAEREANIKALFETSTAGFHPNESEYINEFKPFLPANYLSKRYYFCCDVPQGVAPIFKTGTMEMYFDKHFMQNYQSTDETPSKGFVTPKLSELGGKYYNSGGSNFQGAGDGYTYALGKAEAIRAGKMWGHASFHGQNDCDTTHDNTAQFRDYLTRKGLKRKYLHYAVTREVIRISDPRPDYSGYEEKEPIIIIP